MMELLTTGFDLSGIDVGIMPLDSGIGLFIATGVIDGV